MEIVSIMLQNEHEVFARLSIRQQPSSDFRWA
jgi:hypothetical protein